MNLRFPDIGRFACIDGSWWRAVPSSPPDQHLVNVIVGDRRSFGEFRPRGEVERRWEGAYGTVCVPLSSVDEIVHVGRLGRFRGERVRRLGDVVEGQMAVGLESNDRETAARLGFDGDERFMGFDKMIDPEEFTDVVEEVKVLYRRGGGGVVGG